MARLVDGLLKPSRHSATSLDPSLVRFVAMFFLLNSTAVAWGQAVDKQVLEQVKEGTVLIKIKAGKMQASGSGFVIRGAGDTVLIMTNRHVAVPDPTKLPDGAKAEISVVFRSGTPQEQELPGKILAFDDHVDRDLAMLEVKGVKRVPRPILADQTAVEADFFETMPVYALGFPLGAQIQEITDNRGTNPAITVTPMSISRLPRDPAGRLSLVQLSGAMIGGNSGGPVLDAKGRLVGVAVARIRNENVGFAISPSIIASFLAGDIGLPVGEVLPSQGANAQIKITTRLVDPLGKLKGVAIRFAPQSSSPGEFKPDTKGNWQLLQSGTSVPLTLAEGLASGPVSVPISTPESRKIHVQFVLNDTAGRLTYSKPMAVTIPESPGPIAGLGEPPAPPKTLAKWSCEVNLSDGAKVRNEPGTTTFDVPGGKAMINAPQFKLFNAPCTLVRLQGDFQTAVVVDADFDPGSDKVTKPDGKAFPITFQSAGLVVWQDEKNFIRFERSKGSVSGLQLVSRVVVEMYKDGKEVGLYYKDIPEIPIALLIIRKGGSIQLLLAAPGMKPVIFREIAIDFQNELLVGLSAANLSKRPFQAKLQNFMLKTLEGAEVDVKPVLMTQLVSGGGIKRADGSWILEGANLKVLKTIGGPAGPQTNMADFSGKWSDNRQLLWKAAKTGESLSLETPVDTAGKYEIKAKFTQAPDYAKVKFEIDGKPLNEGKAVDLYAKDVTLAGLMPLGKLTLTKGRHVLKVTVVGKNSSSSNYQFGLDEIQLVPVK